MTEQIFTPEQRQATEKKIAIQQELARRRQQERLRYYNAEGKVHKKQIAFHQNPLKNRWVLGGNRTGKTECGAVEAVYFARGNHPYREIKAPTIGWAVSLTNDVQRDVAQKKLLSYLQPEWIADIIMRDGKKPDFRHLDIVTGTIQTILVKFAKNGVETGGISEIGFKTVEQGREKFQGAALDWVWFDEEPPGEIYEECRMRLLDKKGNIWGTMTPLKGLTWVYDDIYQKSTMFDPTSRIYCDFMEWRDNPFLDQDAITELEADMDEDERDARQYGRFISKSGLVYPEFRFDTHVIDPFEITPSYYDKIVLDNGWQTSAVLFCAHDNEGNVYIFDEIYAQNKTLEELAGLIKQKAEALKWRKLPSGRLSIFADSAIEQTSQHTGMNVQQLLLKYGISANPNVNKNVDAGIQRVKQYLKCREVQGDLKTLFPHGKPQLFIFRNCVNLIQEIQKYAWKTSEDGDAAPKKVFDHCLTGDTVVNTVAGDFCIKDMVGKTGAVYCYDEVTGEKQVSGFHDVRMTQGKAVIYQLSLADGREIKATGDHLILTTKGWKQLKNLNREYAVLDIFHEPCWVLAVEICGEEPVYNMEVDTFHNFCVNGGLIVHNCLDSLRYYIMTLGDVKENVRDTRTEEQRMLSRDKDNALKKFKRQNRKYY